MEKVFAQNSHHSCTQTRYRAAVVRLRKRAASAAAALLTLPVGALQQLLWTYDMTEQLTASAPVVAEEKSQKVLHSAQCCIALMVPWFLFQKEIDALVRASFAWVKSFTEVNGV